MNKILITILFFVLIGFVGAHNIDYTYKEKIIEKQYSPEDDFSFSRITYIDYENDNRFSTYDYRHGYTYRATTEYRDRYYNDLIIVDRDYKRDNRFVAPRYRGNEGVRYYYDYIEHLRDYEKRECYRYPPRDKLFYIECP
jgi:hypothetical protein